MRHWVTFAMAVWMIALAPGAIAQDNASGGIEEEKARFAKLKTMRVQRMESHLTCVRAAMDHQAMKSCDERSKKEMMQERMVQLNAQQNKLDEKKRRLQEKMGSNPAPATAQPAPQTPVKQP